jgi:hypothetical protein
MDPMPSGEWRSDGELDDLGHEIVLDTLREHSMLGRTAFCQRLDRRLVAGAWQAIGFARLFPSLMNGRPKMPDT